MNTRNPLPGQVISDPAHPAWLMRNGGRHLFICSPGGPEDFLYRGKRNADGTRDGDQMQLLDKLAQEGGNCIYMQIVRTNGGEAGDDQTQNPFIDSDPRKGLDERILPQWEHWFTTMDQRGIVICLSFYGNGAKIWNTGDNVRSQEKAFIQGIVRRFRHHRNLIWLVAEDSKETYTPERVRRIAEVIREEDRHGHLIGSCQNPGTSFDAWQTNSALDQFAMHYSAATAIAAHAAAVDAFQKAAGRYQVLYAGNQDTGTSLDSMRRFSWASAMGGLMPIVRQIDVAGAPAAALNQCAQLQRFFESSDFFTMSPRDELASAGTEYVLANPGCSYIAYSGESNGPIGIRDLPAGRYSLKWINCKTGLTVQQSQTISGDKAAFVRPPAIGPECAVWIRCPNDSAKSTAEANIWTPSRTGRHSS